MSVRSFLHIVRTDRRGATLVEFALVSPLFFLVLFGVMDLGMQFYAQHILQGAVSQAGRNSTLEGFVDDQGALDDAVEAAVQTVFSDAILEYKRAAYHEFSQVGKPEEILNDGGIGGVANGEIDPGECFIDINGSGAWERDMGRTGNGGAEDVVRYEVTMRFDRLFPLWALLGQPQSTTLTATTMLRNQPYGSSSAPSDEEICIPLP